MRSLLTFSVLPHVDWALWLCCLQGQREKGETLMSSAKWAWGYRQADGAAIGGARSHIHLCIHAHTHTHTEIYIEVRSKDPVNLTHTHTFFPSMYPCFNVSFGEAHSIYHGTACWHWMTSWARTLNDILSGRDECDLHMQVEQIKKDWVAPWHLQQKAALWEEKALHLKPQPGGAIPILSW